MASLLLSGLPPSGIFVAEVAILFGGVAAGWTAAAAVAALLLALAVAGLLFHMARVAVGPDGVRGPRVVVRTRTAVMLAAPLVVVAVAGLWTPSPVSVALDQLVAILGGGRG